MFVGLSLRLVAVPLRSREKFSGLRTGFVDFAPRSKRLEAVPRGMGEDWTEPTWVGARTERGNLLSSYRSEYGSSTGAGPKKVHEIPYHEQQQSQFRPQNQVNSVSHVKLIQQRPGGIYTSLAPSPITVPNSPQLVLPLHRPDTPATQPRPRPLPPPDQSAPAGPNLCQAYRF